MGPQCIAGLVIGLSFCVMDTAATQWRERSEYPKSYDDFDVYVTDPAVPLTGERALRVGCGADGRPYKYRGKRHVTELTSALGDDVKKVWVGAVDTTTPWVWTSGRYLYQLMGLLPSHLVTLSDAVWLPGNNAFLCSLHCRQVSFVLLQGNKCACLKTRPKLLPVSGKMFRCPGTYEEYCGTASAFTVYKNMLAKTVKWARLGDKARYHGTKAFLYRSPSSEHPLVTLGAEVDPLDKKGRICNDTVFSIGPQHLTHLWVQHVQDGPMTWRQALEACMNQGRQLMLLPREARDCVQEVKGELGKGQGYWIGLSRRSVALWVDGTEVKTDVNNRNRGQVACLTMSLTSKTPTFTFESCTGLSLPTLCERGSASRIHTFTHDAEGRHIVTNTASDDGGSLGDYSGTVSILVAVLVILTLLSVVLLVLLWNRDRWMPQKPASGSRKRSSATDQIRRVSSAGRCRLSSNRMSDMSTSATSVTDHVHLCNVHVMSDQLLRHDALSHKGKELQPSTLRAGNADHGSRPTSASLGYTEVCLVGERGSSRSEPCVNVVSLQQPEIPPPTAAASTTEKRRPSSVRILDCGLESSQSSATGSDEAYSVLGYRKSIQNACSDFKRTAYSHVMINRGADEEEGDRSALYDVAVIKPSRVRCIDNDYDHTVPASAALSKAAERCVGHGDPQDSRLILEVPGARCDESDV